jgi:hypothetical protein
MMSLTPCEPNSSSGPTPGFSPGFSPDSRSHSITLVQEELLIVSMRPSFMVLLHLTLSRSPLPVPSRRGLFDEGDGLWTARMRSTRQCFAPQHLDHRDRLPL